MITARSPDAIFIDQGRADRAATPAIGPNIVLQLIPACRDIAGYDRLHKVFADCGLAHWLDHPPADMILAADAALLFRAVHQHLGTDQARAVLTRAGELTADYLLAHRIPKFAQVLLGLMPRVLAIRILTRAISRHAWTFAGAGRFSADFAPMLHFQIAANPLTFGLTAPEPACHWHAAVFTRIFQTILRQEVSVVETNCAAVSGDACRFRFEM